MGKREKSDVSVYRGRSVSNERSRRMEVASVSKALDAHRSNVWVTFRCARVGMRFYVGFERGPGGLYEVDEIVRDTPELQFDGLFRGAKVLSGSRQFDVSAFSFEHWSCPFCGHSGSSHLSPVIHCGACKELVCGGGIRTKWTGQTVFKCHPGCRHQGPIKGQFSKMRGGRLKHGRVASQAPALPSIARLMLPKE